VVGGTFYVRLPNGSKTQVVASTATTASTRATRSSAPSSSPIRSSADHPRDGVEARRHGHRSQRPAAPNSTYILEDAIAINDNGDIVGIGGDFATGQEIGFLMQAGYVVDSTGDEPDTNAGDGSCLTSQGTCTLRAASRRSARHVDRADVDQLRAARGATSIAPTSALPPITKPVAIDGSTNLGGRLLLEGAGAGSGATAGCPGGRVDDPGIKIQHFDGAGIAYRCRMR